MVLLAKDPIIPNYDLSSLRVINSSSAPLKEDLLQATYKRLKIPVKQGYGMTETAPMVLLERYKFAYVREQLHSGKTGSLLVDILRK